MAAPRSRPDPALMAEHNDFGLAAEQLAADLLTQRGWRVLHRNWRFRRRELDLVVRRAGVVAFVEVRARSSARCGHPLDTIGTRKRRDLEVAARGWVERHGRSSDTYRFDVVTVLKAGDARGPVVEYLEDAWRL
jgi:putative endonuclease